MRCRRKFSNRTPTRDDNKKDGFSKREKRMKSTNQTGRRQSREVFLIYEPSLRFRGNKSDTTCLQTLKCHRSIAQLTPMGQ